MRRAEQINFKISADERKRLDRVSAYFGRTDGEVLRHLLWIADQALSSGEASRLVGEGEATIASVLSVPISPFEYACIKLKCTGEELREVIHAGLFHREPFTRAQVDEWLEDITLRDPRAQLKRMRANKQRP